MKSNTVRAHAQLTHHQQQQHTHTHEQKQQHEKDTRLNTKPTSITAYALYRKPPRNSFDLNHMQQQEEHTRTRCGPKRTCQEVGELVRIRSSHIQDPHTADVFGHGRVSINEQKSNSEAKGTGRNRKQENGICTKLYTPKSCSTVRFAGFGVVIATDRESISESVTVRVGRQQGRSTTLSVHQSF